MGLALAAGFAYLLRIRYRPYYLKYLIYRHRFFDVKGLTTQGIFTLELERVFVALSMASQSKVQIPADPVQSSCEDGHVIWEYLKSGRIPDRNLVILGPPGSGKTTLLQYMTLTLAAGWRRRRQVNAPNKLPILLFLRNHAEAIKAKPELSLVDALQASLALWKIEVRPNWFEAALEKGRCFIMLDGLDEVADLETRKIVVRWVEGQMSAYARNQFVITSRPFGYHSNPLDRVTVLEVCAFTAMQIRHFVHNWYLANEIMSAQRDDSGVRKMAQKGAEDLLERLRKSSALSALAVNPLLLTMIATVHRYRSSLPGRRVELYAEICEVFLGKRQEARGLVMDLTPAQKQRVLQPLAYHMMCQHVQEIKLADALAIIKNPLARVSIYSSGQDFLTMIENSSGLLLERESGIYSFAHLTFQEYLAAVHVWEQKLEKELEAHVEESWWHETIRLYAAQANATSIIIACLRKARSVTALTLAFECLSEAQEIDPEVRRDLEQITTVSDERWNSEQYRIMIEALLNLRLRRMIRISEDKFIDDTLITHDEYQFFLDERRLEGQYHQPDHWLTDDYPSTQGSEPVLGVRSADALAFCEWLTQREGDEWRYRLPFINEVKRDSFLEIEGVGYWVLASDEAIQCVGNNIPAGGNDNGMLIEQVQRDLAKARALDCALKPDLDPNGDFFDFIRYYACSRKRNQAMARIRTLNLSPAEHDLIIELGQKLARDLDNDLNRIGIRPGMPYQISISLDLASALGLEPTFSSAIHTIARIRNAARLRSLIRNRDRTAPQILSSFDVSRAQALVQIIQLQQLYTRDYNYTLDFSQIPDLGLSESPYVQVLRKALAMVLDRNRSQILRQIGSHEADWSQVSDFLRWYIRLVALTLATELQFRLDSPKSAATTWFPSSRREASAQQAEIQSLIKACLNVYIDFTILEARIQRILPAFEGIRILKERM